MTHPTPEDPGLAPAIERWRAGDRAVLGTIYAACFPLVREIVHLRLGRALRVSVDSMDVVQDAFIGMLRAAPPQDVRTSGQLTAYLATAALNRVREIHRAQSTGKRDRQREQASPGDSGRPDWLPDPSPTPSEISMGRETYERYLAAVTALPAREREAVVLARHLGLSSERAAAELELPTPGAFRALLTRALAKVSLAMGAGSEGAAGADA